MQNSFSSVLSGKNPADRLSDDIVPGSDLIGDAVGSSGRFERKASFRRKIGSLIRSSAELPAVINRGLQPIRRSLSFSKDLNRLQEPSKPSRPSSAQWYNSLVSLVEDECLDELDIAPPRNSTSEELLSPKVQVTRTRSLTDTTFVRFSFVRAQLSTEILPRLDPLTRALCW